MSQFLSSLKNKMKMVAARASDIVAQAADIVAPTLYESRVDEFHHRWSIVSRFLESVMARDLDPSEQRRLLLESHTRDSLQKMVLLIYAEESTIDRLELSLATSHRSNRNRSTSTSSTASATDADASSQQQRECLEYLLERQILPHLCDAGKRDEPSGIMSLTMQFVSALLSRVNYPLLPTREIHVSVVSLIEAATKREVEDPVVRKCLISLLNVLWKKLRADPVQTEFFFLHVDRMIAQPGATTTTPTASFEENNDSASDRSSCTLLSPTTSLFQQPSAVSELVLFTGLLPHMYAPGKVGDKCREALVIAAAVHENALCRFIVQLTPFCHYAVNGVIAAFENLPKTLPESSDTTTERGIAAELLLLATRLRFCCTLAMVARFELINHDVSTGLETRTSIANELLLQFCSRFLNGPLFDGLVHPSEAAARTATLYARIILEELVACCSDTTANPLLFVYIQFLLQPPFPGPSATEPTEATEASIDLPSELLYRIDALSPSLSIATIDLFTSLLELSDDYVDATLLQSLRSSTPPIRRRSSSVLSPVNPHGGAIWFATRFPNSAVASNVHLYKIQAFDSVGDAIEIPSAVDDELENGADQVLSLLSYIADAEFAACQRAPQAIDDDESDDDESDLESERLLSTTTTTTTTSRTAATRNAMPPLRDVRLTLTLPSFSPVTSIFQHQRSCCASVSASRQAPTNAAATARMPLLWTRASAPSGALSSQPTTAPRNDALPLFMRVVFRRVERLLELSVEENVALSGLVVAVARKPRCASIVFDATDTRPIGQSLRTILERVYADAQRRMARLSHGASKRVVLERQLLGHSSSSNSSSSEDGSSTTSGIDASELRLLRGAIVLDEMLKELCSVLFAKERVRNLPLKPEGFYFEPHAPTHMRSSSNRWHQTSGANNAVRTTRCTNRTTSIDSNVSETTSVCSSSSDGLLSPTAAAAGAFVVGEREGATTTSKHTSVDNELEVLLAEAEVRIASILQLSSTSSRNSDGSDGTTTTTRAAAAAAASGATVDAVIEALAASALE